MEPGDPDNGQNNLADHLADQTAPIRRTSSRIARLNRMASQSDHARPYPHFQHVSTWLSQNRQMERQRSYYSNYYSSNRNRGSQPPNASQTTRAPPAPRQMASATFPSTPSASATTTRERTPPFIDRISEQLISINNAATQTSSNASNSTDASNNNTSTNTTNTSRLFSLEPFNEYLRTIGAFIGHVGRQSIVLNAPTGNNATNNNGGVNFDIEPINFDNLFAFPENFFNDGLTKQEINRHTISYEYKPALPGGKRKRIKTEESDIPSTSSTTVATVANDSCSICLDKFNPNVHVRRLPCLHVFHIKCIDKWLKRNKKCPICRISITINYDTLMSSLESGTSIDQCLSQQETSTRPTFRPTITLSLQSVRGNSEITLSGSIVHATVELNPSTSTSSPSTSGSSQ